MSFFSLAESSLTIPTRINHKSAIPWTLIPFGQGGKREHTQPDSAPSSYSDPQFPHPSPHYYSDLNSPQHQYCSDSADYLPTTASATPVVNVAVAGSDDDDDDDDVVVADAGQKVCWDLAQIPSRRGHYCWFHLGFRCCGSSVQFMLDSLIYRNTGIEWHTNAAAIRSSAP